MPDSPSWFGQSGQALPDSTDAHGILVPPIDDGGHDVQEDYATSLNVCTSKRADIIAIFTVACDCERCNTPHKAAVDFNPVKLNR